MSTLDRLDAAAKSRFGVRAYVQQKLSTRGLVYVLKHKSDDGWHETQLGVNYQESEAKLWTV